MTCRPYKTYLKMEGRFKKIYTAAFCIYLAAVCILCFIRPSSLPEMDVKTFLGIPIDKILHFLMFLPYPILAGMVFINRDCTTACGIAVLAIIAVTGIGISYGTEVIQAHTGYRSYEIADFYADLTGIATGSIAAFAYLIYSRPKK